MAGIRFFSRIIHKLPVGRIDALCSFKPHNATLYIRELLSDFRDAFQGTPFSSLTEASSCIYAPRFRLNSGTVAHRFSSDHGLRTPPPFSKVTPGHVASRLRLFEYSTRIYPNILDAWMKHYLPPMRTRSFSTMCPAQPRSLGHSFTTSPSELERTLVYDWNTYPVST